MTHTEVNKSFFGMRLH